MMNGPGLYVSVLAEILRENGVIQGEEYILFVLSNPIK
jgi:hypothetical protein